jgi:HSP20 family molecular chaperone IbpA
MALLTRARRSLAVYPAAPYQALGLPVTGGAPVDVEETEDAFRVELELPGVAAADVQIEVRDGEIRVFGSFGERRREGTLRHHARRTGEFEYLVALPGDVEADDAEAELDRGVLTIKAPKTDGQRARRIAVQAPLETIAANPAAKARQLREAAPAMGGTGQVGRSATA